MSPDRERLLKSGREEQRNQEAGAEESRRKDSGECAKVRKAPLGFRVRERGASEPLRSRSGPGVTDGTEWESSVSAGVSAQIDLGSLFPWSAKTARVEKSAIEVQRLNEELQSKRDAVALEAGKVLLDLSKARAQIDAGEKARELAEELYLASKEMYENGLLSIMEYDDAQVGLSDSRVGYLTYIYDYRKALYDLMDAIGTDTM